MFIAPAASAGTIVNAVPLTPTNMTEFSPTRNDADYAGKYMTIASNPKTGKNLFAYTAYTSVGGVYGYYYGAQVTDSSGPVGAETVLASIASGCAYSGSIQMASAYNPVSGGWVVAYKEGCGDFLWKAQFLNADGSLDGGAVPISSATPDTDNAWQIAVAWNSNAKNFLFAWHNYNSSSNSLPNFIGRVVEPDGTVTGSEIDLMPSLADYNDYGPLSLAYSPESDHYLLVTRIDGEIETQLIGGNGQPIGDYLALSGGDYAPTVAYNSFRDEFAVATEESSGGFYPVNIQRIDASDGSLIGEWETPAPSGIEPYGYRPRIVASACADEYFVSASGDENGENGGQYGYRVAGDLSTSLGSLHYLSSGQSSYAQRVNSTYNQKTNQYWSGWAGSPTGPSSDWDIYASPVTAGTQSAGCASAKSKPKLKKRGTAGATSLRVEVGCGKGTAPCRIRLSGKLKGGSGKLRAKTVKLGRKAKTVTLDYTDPLISELARNGGGRIKVKAKEIGGGTRTIVVTVPASVTG